MSLFADKIWNMESLLDLKYDWLHNKIITDSPAKLYQLAMVKTAICLWNGEEITYKKLSKVVLKKIPFLTLAKLVKNDVAHMVELLFTQMLELNILISIHASKHVTVCKSKIYWTPQGTIDHKRTFETLVDATDLELEIRFTIAIFSCMKDRINALSIQLPSSYLSRNDHLKDIITNMDGITTTKKHFNIPEPGHNYFEGFKRVLYQTNFLSIHYYWYHLTEQEKLFFLKPEYFARFRKKALFFFTECDKEEKLQLIQNEYCCLWIAVNLTSPELLPVFDKCIKDLLLFLTADSVVKLLCVVVEYLMLTVAYKKKYLEISAMLLQVLKNEHNLTSLQSHSDNALMRVLYDLMFKEGQKLVIDFLDSAIIKNVEWIKLQFTYISRALAFLLIASLKCERLELVFNSAFPTIEDRHEFLNKGEFFNNVICHAIVFLEQLPEDAEKIVSLLFLDFEDLAKFKIRFFEEQGCQVFYHFVKNGKWNLAIDFIKLFCVSKEKFKHFCNRFFTLIHFANLFHNGDRSITVIASFIKIRLMFEFKCFSLKHIFFRRNYNSRETHL